MTYVNDCNNRGRGLILGGSTEYVDTHGPYVVPLTLPTRGLFVNNVLTSSCPSGRSSDGPKRVYPKRPFLLEDKNLSRRY